MLIDETRGCVEYRFFRPSTRHVFVVNELDGWKPSPAEMIGGGSSVAPKLITRGAVVLSYDHQGASRMPMQIGARAEHGFDQPVELLTDCHRRIEYFLGILEKVAQERRGVSLCDEHRRAVDVALTYFDTAAPRHTEDEEQSLFPLIRKMNQQEAQNASRQLATLEADHTTGNALHTQLRISFRRWADQGYLEAPARRELEAALHALREMYRRHIEVEEREIFPVAVAVLSHDQLAQLGQEMAERRGSAVGSPASCLESVRHLSRSQHGSVPQ